MSPKSTNRPGPGQMAIPDVLEQVPAEVDLERKRAIGSMLKPEAFGYTLEDLADVTAEHLALTEVNSLKQAIYGGYGKNVVNGLAFNDDEYDTMIRFPKAFGGHAERQARKKRRLDHDLERREEKARRAVGHAFESKLEPLNQALQGLKNEQAWLDTLALAIQRRGWHINKTNAEMQMMLTSVHLFSFQNILEVVGIRQDWDAETKMIAPKALVMRITTGRQNLRLAKLSEMQKFASAYAYKREKMLNSRLKIAEDKIKRFGSTALET